MINFHHKKLLANISCLYKNRPKVPLIQREGIILYSNLEFAFYNEDALKKLVNIALSCLIDCGDIYNIFLPRGWKEDCKGEILLTSKRHINRLPNSSIK